MNIDELSSALPKPWLTIRADTIEAVNLQATFTETQSIALVDQVSVPNPAVGSHALFADLSGTLSTTNALGDTVQYAVVPAAARIVAIASTVLLGVQTSADVLVNLSANSSAIIPAGSCSQGDVYRFKLRVNVDAPDPGNSSIIEVGTVAAGVLFSFPIIAPVAFADVPVECNFDMIVADPANVNICGQIYGYIGSPPVNTGFAFCAPPIPLDLTVAQTLTCTYTTADFTSATFTERIFYKLL